MALEREEKRPDPGGWSGRAVLLWGAGMLLALLLVWLGGLPALMTILGIFPAESAPLARP